MKFSYPAKDESGKKADSQKRFHALLPYLSNTDPAEKDNSAATPGGREHDDKSPPNPHLRRLYRVLRGFEASAANPGGSDADSGPRYRSLSAGSFCPFPAIPAWDLLPKISHTPVHEGSSCCLQSTPGDAHVLPNSQVKRFHLRQSFL